MTAHPPRSQAEIDAEVLPQDAHRALAHGAILLDVRTQRERDAAQLAGGLAIPLGELQQRTDDLDDVRDRTILVLCHKGVRSMRAALMLRQLGFAQAFSISGGIDRWSLEVDPTIPRY